MDYIQANPQLNNVQELKTEFEKVYGEVHYTNCTNNIYTFDEIIEFLSQRNKIYTNTNGVEVDEEHRCDHD
jgi:probable metal-binding protein